LLVYLGYERLDRRQYRQSEEPEISGALCEAIEQVLDDAESDDWVDDYEIHDDRPVHDAKRKGKHRRRVDIKLWFLTHDFIPFTARRSNAYGLFTAKCQLKSSVNYHSLSDCEAATPVLFRGEVARNQ
jgi:hypothetical protein